MIVWLASYPRSGNTLLRTLLHQHFGLETFSDESGEAQIVGWTETAKAALGYREIPCEWEKFYLQAHQSDRLHLIKTHRPPVDGNKAIYVVRDGRSAYVSYARYHASFIKEKPQSLLGLILGMDFYGGWTEHYRLWAQSPNQLLVFRYEDLVAPTQNLLEKISDFLGCAQPEGGWENPFDKLNRENPSFFREGHVHWQGSDDWSDLIGAIFFSLHGTLMVELGYAKSTEVDQAIDRLAPEVVELLGISKQLMSDLAGYKRVCRERQIVIDDLKRACDERLVLIEALNKRLEWER